MNVRVHIHDSGSHRSWLVRPSRFRDAFDPSKHPKGGNPANKGQFSKTSGSKTAPSEGGESEQSRPQVQRSQRRQERPDLQAHRGERPDLQGQSTRQRPPKIDRKKLQGSMAKSPKGELKQSTKDLDELYDKSKEAEENFIKDVSDLAAQYGGRALFTPEEYAEPGGILKSRASANEKLKDDDINGDPSKLLDIVRGTVACKDVTTTRAAAKDFIEYMGSSVVRVKDRIVNPMGGYRDIQVNFRCPNGVIAELQFNSETMLHEKNYGEGHKLYEISRDIKRNRPADHAKHMLDWIDLKSAEVYNAAYKSDGNGNW